MRDFTGRQFTCGFYPDIVFTVVEDNGSTLIGVDPMGEMEEFLDADIKLLPRKVHAIELVKIDAKELKEQLTEYGVKVLRCRQFGQGATIAIEKSESNLEDFYSFALAVGLKRMDGNDARVIASGTKFYDFGTVYQFQED